MRSRPYFGLCLTAAIALILVSIAQRLWFLIDHCPLDLSGDEAHYWEWSRRLDWSYYSKGPLVAWLIALGRWLLADWSQHLVGNEALAVRIPAIVLSSLTGLGIYVLSLQTLRRPVLALASLAITATIPITAAGAILMTIDAPLACAWAWALVCIHRGLQCDSLAAWMTAGVLIALGTLAKFNMVFIYAVIGLFLITEPSLRKQWFKPGPWLAAVVGLAGWLPILVWNVQHDWVSFRHVAGQAGVTGKTALDVLGPVEYAAGQAAVLGPVWFICLLFAMRFGWMAIPKPEAHSDDPQPVSDAHEPAWSLRFLAICTAVPFTVFLIFSLITKIQPNWPAVGLIAGAPLLVYWLATGWVTPALRIRRRWIVGSGITLGLGASVLAYHTEWLMPAFQWLVRDARPWELTPVAKYDPTARLRGWSELGAAVGEVLKMEKAAGRDPLIMTDDYQVASEIAFYTPGNPIVTCVQSVLGNRRSQYDIWPNPIRDHDLFTGKPVIFVGSRHPLLSGERGGRAVLENMRLIRTVEHQVRGATLQVWAIHLADSFAGFPADLRQEKF